ncbi:SNARE domain protein [Teladorsagia circumcincta]|uniref:SNARE domain protein n=1 Tax=Teladorsagia circumcincta TaxID=45464 RepID=A0A2G9UTY6_TELCI|nr:SNARE domain protein [Teladorsagia circumcincta]
MRLDSDKETNEEALLARLRLLFDELSRVFKQFSDDLDEVVKAVNEEFQMKPSTGLAAERAQNQVHENDPKDQPLSRGNEIGDVEKAMQTASTNAMKGESDEKAVLLEVKQRNEDLLLLEKAVSMLNSLHEHLNFLVHTQDTTLNRIDVNISQAAEYTEKVMNDTSQARKLNEEAREKRILVFFLLGLLLFILIVTLITFIRDSVMIYAYRFIVKATVPHPHRSDLLESEGD